MEYFHLDCLVVGAGVVGLAIARSLAHAGREVWVVEKAPYFGDGISSRNSEVIHAGIYYPAGSLKSRLCREGKELLYHYCSAHQIPHKRCGKVIVASGTDQIAKLDGIVKSAEANDVVDLRPLSRGDLKSLEPKLRGDAGLLSPSTGIVDSHALMTQLCADIEQAGGQIVFNSEVCARRLQSGRFELELKGQEAVLIADTLVNAAGLQAADLIAQCDAGTLEVPEMHFAKGNYFTYSSPVPFAHLVYPVPEAGGLGVHLTLDMGGMAKFGPDVEWLEKGEAFNYQVSETRRAQFIDRVREYWPSVQVDRMVPGYAGIRPKLSGPGEPAADFFVQDASDHQIEGLINLYGIESPGLTASLALGEYVAAKL